MKQKNRKRGKLFFIGFSTLAVSTNLMLLLSEKALYSLVTIATSEAIVLFHLVTGGKYL